MKAFPTAILSSQAISNLMGIGCERLCMPLGIPMIARARPCHSRCMATRLPCLKDVFDNDWLEVSRDSGSSILLSDLELVCSCHSLSSQIPRGDIVLEYSCTCHHND